MGKNHRSTRPSRNPPAPHQSYRSEIHSVVSDDVRPEDSLSNGPFTDQLDGRRLKHRSRHTSHPSNDTAPKHSRGTRHSRTPNHYSLGMTAIALHQDPPSRRWPPDQKRWSIGVRYQSDEVDRGLHGTFTKLPGQTVRQSLLHPQFTKDESRRKSSGSQSKHQRSNSQHRDRNGDSTRRSEGGRQRRPERGRRGSTQNYGGNSGPRLTAKNLTSNSKNSEREHQRSHRQAPDHPTVTQEAAKIRPTRDSTSKAKSSGPQTSRVPRRRVRDSPEQTESSPVAPGLPSQGRSRDTERIRGIATETHPDEAEMNPAANDSILDYCLDLPTPTLEPRDVARHFPQPTPAPEPMDEERRRQDHARRRSSRKHPSRPRRAVMDGHRPRHDREPSMGSSYSHEKWTKTTKRPPESGCCVVL